ncbi:MAG TPA: tetratricopeptide repeat protein, partial [Blastocatellia bacterium]|nr:tetratricopeptide repeat protein [Blastocatellia bacterium]
KEVADNPNDFDSNLYMGILLKRDKLLDESKEIADNPNDFDSNLYMGILLKRDKLLDESLSYLTRAARLRPRDSYARYHLGGVYASLGKPGEAQSLLEGVVKDYPEFVEARVLLASVYYRLNRKEDGNRERAIIQKLNAEQQAKQPGAQDPDPVKPPNDFQR